MKQKSPTKQELLQEIVRLRYELLQYRPSSDPSTTVRTEPASDAVDRATSEEIPNDLVWNSEDLNLPELDEKLPPGEMPRFLDFRRSSKQLEGTEGYGYKDLTESGSFDLRWLHLVSFGRLLQAMPIPILLIDGRGTIQLANRTFMTMADISSQILGGSFYSMFRTPDEADEVHGLVQNVVGNRKPEFREGCLNVFGKEIWIRMNLRSLRFGSERSVLVVMEDLTAERREALLNEKYRKLVHFFPVGIAEFALPRPVSLEAPLEELFSIILEATVTEGNMEFARLQGLDNEEDLKGLSLHETLAIEDKTPELLSHWLENRFLIGSVETEERGDADEYRYFETTLFGNVQDGSLVQFWGIKRDVTVNKRAENALVKKISTIDELYEHIMQAEKAKSIAAHTRNVAHELRQPLAIIGGFARRVARESSASAEPAEQAKWDFLGIVIREVERLERILARLIDFTKHEAIDLQHMDPNEQIRYVLRLNDWRMKEKNIRLETDLSDEVGEILLDAERFQQLVRNLMANAIEASDPGGAIQVETGVSIPSRKAQETGQLEADTYFEMKIRNFGAPIPEDHHQMIFNPFFTTKQDATGLGLTLCKKIVEEHGGSISVRSDGDGTLSTVWIPADGTCKIT
ncbi:ATP-binding protein [Thermodesulfobacteriota bacterium]